jgi:hypothetical protein
MDLLDIILMSLEHGPLPPWSKSQSGKVIQLKMLKLLLDDRY